MNCASANILGIGTDDVLLKSRVAVLAHNGYKAKAAVVPDAYKQLRTMKFDLIIASARLAETQSGNFHAAIPPETPTLLLDGLTFPVDMLAAVAEKLQRSARSKDV